MNIHARLLLFTALLVTTVTQGRAQQVSVISLEETIEYALQNNVTVKNAQLDIVASKATVGETTAQGLLQITGNVDVNKNLIVPSQPFPTIFLDRKSTRLN